MQSKKVTGKIIDQVTGKPLHNATVTVKGATQTTTTNSLRSFTMPSSVLSISYIGYGIKAIKVGSLSSPFRNKLIFNGLKPLQKFC